MLLPDRKIFADCLNSIWLGGGGGVIQFESTKE